MPRERIGMRAVERTDDDAFLGMRGLHRLESCHDDIENRLATRVSRVPVMQQRQPMRGSSTPFEELRLPRVISTKTANARSQAGPGRAGARLPRLSQRRWQGPG
jgi:hypothetical protein